MGVEEGIMCNKEVPSFKSLIFWLCHKNQISTDMEAIIWNSDWFICADMTFKILE